MAYILGQNMPLSNSSSGMLTRSPHTCVVKSNGKDVRAAVYRPPPTAGVLQPIGLEFDSSSLKPFEVFIAPC